MQRALGLLVDVDELAEDADDLAAGIQRDRADLDIDPVAVLLDEYDLRVGDLGGTGDLLREHLARTAALLGCGPR